MADARYWSKETITNFIELYKSYPCLWKIKSKDYTNRNLKNAAYDKLVEFCKTINPEANRDYVVKKIQSFRGSFRKELKKMEESKRSGAGADEIHTPTLWYFDLLLFTIDQELPTPSISNVLEEESENCVTEETQENEILQQDENEKDVESNIEQVSTDTPIEAPLCQELPKGPPAPIKKRKTSNNKTQIDFINYCKTQLETKESLDEFDATAIAWAKKMKRMNPTQAIYADMLINTIINQGLLNQLTTDTTIVHQLPSSEIIPPSPSPFSPLSPYSTVSSNSSTRQGQTSQQSTDLTCFYEQASNTYEMTNLN